MSEGHVYLCKWKQTEDGFRIWVDRKPRLCAEGDTLEDAKNELSHVIGLEFGDGEAVFDLDPPELPSQYVALSYNSSWRSPADFTREEFASLYEGGLCDFCLIPIGPRSKQQLRASYTGDGDLLGSWLRGPRSRLVSANLRALISQRAKLPVEWRPVEIVPKTARQFFEFLPKRSVPGIADRNQKVSGWRCPKCGFRMFDVFGQYHPFICAIDLRRRVPAAFVIGDAHGANLAISVSDWSSLRGKKGTRDVLSRPVEILPAARVIREPEVRTLTEEGSAAIRREFERGLRRAFHT
jgi:hypothetical protein